MNVLTNRLVVLTSKRREMIHWLWLWVLAGIVVSVVHGVVSGQDPSVTKIAGQLVPASEGAAQEAEAHSGVGQDGTGRPIPMPNVDQPDLFRYPNSEENFEGNAVSLDELLELQRKGDFNKALKGWHRVRLTAGSQTWKHVGIGIALLQLDQLDEAMDQLERAVELDPNNAVAEYFMGRVRQAQGRQVPFWYEPDRELPYRLASVIEPKNLSPRGTIEERGGRRSIKFLPHFIDDAYDRLARQHFRRSIVLAPKCDLDRVIHVLDEPSPLLQLTALRSDGRKPVTVGDFLDSIGERDYVRRAVAELGVKRLH